MSPEVHQHASGDGDFWSEWPAVRSERKSSNRKCSDYCL